MVNGHEIIRTILEKPTDVNDGQTPPQKYYNLQVRTVDVQGSICTDIYMQNPKPVYLQAWIEAYGEGANPSDGGPIAIDLQSGYEYVQLTEGSPFANGRTVIIDPLPSAPPSDSDVTVTIMVSAPLEGQPFSAPVNIRLICGQRYILEVT